MVVHVVNTLAQTSPIQQETLLAEAEKAFAGRGEEIQEGINLYLKALTERSEAQGYKMFVTAAQVDADTAGPVKVFTGAYWNSEVDGTWATELTDPKVVITVTWIRI